MSDIPKHLDKKLVRAMNHLRKGIALINEIEQDAGISEIVDDEHKWQFTMLFSNAEVNDITRAREVLKEYLDKKGTSNG